MHNMTYMNGRVRYRIQPPNPRRSDGQKDTAPIISTDQLYNCAGMLQAIDGQNLEGQNSICLPSPTPFQHSLTSPPSTIERIEARGRAGDGWRGKDEGDFPILTASRCMEAFVTDSLLQYSALCWLFVSTDIIIRAITVNWVQ